MVICRQPEDPGYPDSLTDNGAKRVLSHIVPGRLGHLGVRRHGPVRASLDVGRRGPRWKPQKDDFHEWPISGAGIGGG